MKKLSAMLLVALMIAALLAGPVFAASEGDGSADIPETAAPGAGDPEVLSPEITEPPVPGVSPTPGIDITDPPVPQVESPQTGVSDSVILVSIVALAALGASAVFVRKAMAR